MEIKIEKGIPVAERQYGSMSGVTGLVRTMEIGDSIFLPGKSGKAGYLARYSKGKITVRSITENGVKGVRIWRIE